MLIDGRTLNNLFANKKVALVGNSIGLENDVCGDEIDSHDIVCRINKGLLNTNNTKVFGGRTDILFYSDYRVIADVLDSTPLDTKLICNLSNPKYVFLNYDTYIIHENFKNYVRKITGYKELPAKKYWPSNGLTAICLILQQKPKKISLYGFDWNRNRTFYHSRKKTSRRHKWQIEKKFVNLLREIENTELSL